MPLDLDHPAIALYPTPRLQRWGGGLLALAVIAVLGWFLWSRAGNQLTTGGARAEQVVVAAILAAAALIAAIYLLVQMRYTIARGTLNRELTLLGLVSLTRRELCPIGSAEIIEEGYAVERTVLADASDTYIDEDGDEVQRVLKAGRVGRFRLWLWHEGHKILIADGLDSEEQLVAVRQLQVWGRSVGAPAAPRPRP